MAGSGAVAQLGDCVEGRCRALIFFVFGGLEVTRMAGRAVGRIGGEAIRHRLRIRGVAIEALQRAGVRSRIVGRTVRKGHGRQPGRGAVTSAALQRGHEVVAGLASGRSTIVAARAVCSDRRVIDRGWQPRRGPMTGAALCSSGDVGGGLADCDRIVVAARTRALDLSMIDPHARPAG